MAIMHMRDSGGSDQLDGSQDSGKWLDSGCLL